VGGDESTNFHVTALSPSFLEPGLNLIAVEVHQASPESSDLSFDLELSGFPAGALPVLEIGRREEGVVLSWPAWATDFTLYSSVFLAPLAAWLPMTNAATTAAGLWQVVLPANPAPPSSNCGNPKSQSLRSVVKTFGAAGSSASGSPSLFMSTRSPLGAATSRQAPGLP